MTNTGNMPTYRNLLHILKVLDKEQLDCVPTIYNAATDEYLPIDRFVFASGEDKILAIDHPYFRVDS